MEIERSLSMGAKSKLNVSERREVVLSLLRREEPAGVLARRYGVSENTLHCRRGETENRIKEQQLGLFADRTSCHNFVGNQFRGLGGLAAAGSRQKTPEGSMSALYQSAGFVNGDTGEQSPGRNERERSKIAVREPVECP